MYSCYALTWSSGIKDHFPNFLQKGIRNWCHAVSGSWSLPSIKNWEVRERICNQHLLRCSRTRQNFGLMFSWLWTQASAYVAAWWDEQNWTQHIFEKEISFVSFSVEEPGRLITSRGLGSPCNWDGRNYAPQLCTSKGFKPLLLTCFTLRDTLHLEVTAKRRSWASLESQWARSQHTETLFLQNSLKWQPDKLANTNHPGQTPRPRCTPSLKNEAIADSELIDCGDAHCLFRTRKLSPVFHIWGLKVVPGVWGL